LRKGTANYISEHFYRSKSSVLYVCTCIHVRTWDTCRNEIIM